jgi:hypothetical protein
MEIKTMPQPQQVHVDASLTQLSVAFRNNDYVADIIAPTVPVRKQSDRYFIYDSNREGMRITSDSRAPGAEAEEVNFELSTDSYFCDDHALSSAIPDEERENADPVILPDIDRTEFLTDRILLNREAALEEKLRTTNGIGENLLGLGSGWDSSGSDPIADVRTARAAVFAAVQRRANIVVMPFDVFEAFRNHDAVRDMIKYTGAGIVTEQIAATLLDVDKVVVPRSFRNNAPMGQPAVVAPVWGSNVYVLHAPDRPGLKQVSLAYTFSWNGASGATGGWWLTAGANLAARQT